MFQRKLAVHTDKKLEVSNAQVRKVCASLLRVATRSGFGPAQGWFTNSGYLRYSGERRSYKLMQKKENITRRLAKKNLVKRGDYRGI